jgi:formamidopyrimidine-DNA glycosylase
VRLGETAILLSIAGPAPTGLNNMPELPEVETVSRGLDHAMAGRRFARVEVNRPDLRFPFPDGFAERLCGRQIERVTRRAKYVLVALDDGTTLLMHLGMSGRFAVEAGADTLRPGEFHRNVADRGRHDHVIFTLSDNTTITYADPRRFGFMDIVTAGGMADHPRLAGLGIEPIGNDMNAAALSKLFAGRNTSLKAALLDQKLIAGIGNIYACEALFEAGLSPRRKAASLATGLQRRLLRAERLAAAIVDVLSRAIAAGGSSLRDHRRTDGELGYFQHSFRVYDRAGEACANPACDGRVKRIVQNNRSTFFCPSCQR